MKALELLEQLLNIPSVNGLDEVTIAEYIAEYFAERGIKSEILRIDGTHADVTAVIPGRTDRIILFNGHMDTVPYGEPGAWETSPDKAVIKNGRIFCRGASDMKSGLAALVYVLGEIGGNPGACKEQSGCLTEHTLVFLGTCDEEKSGLGARYFIDKAGLPEGAVPELCLIGEPTGCSLGVAQKGCLWLKLSVKGTTSHGAIPEEGANAIEYGYRAFSALKEYVERMSHNVLGHATMQINMVSGGNVPNMTADWAELTADIRLVPPVKAEEVIRKLKEICGELKGSSVMPLDFGIEVGNDRMAIDDAGLGDWISAFDRASGRRHEHIGIAYFTDASVFRTQYKETPVLLYGPGEPSMCHKANEYAELAKYELAVKELMDFCRIL